MTPATAATLKSFLPPHQAPAGGTYRLPGSRLALHCGYATKSFDRARMTVDSVLTYPGPDYDGDTVNPAGGDWKREFPANPLVNWAHGVPIGRGTIPTLKAFPGEANKLPVGTTRFFQTKADTKGLNLVGRDRDGRVSTAYSVDECLHAADSAARLVFDGLADGVSIEFKPDGIEGKAFWPTGEKSLLLGRPEMHWEKWVGMGWAHARECKNPSAAVITDKAFRIAESGKIGSHTLSPLILKSFLPLRDRKPKYVRVERKAMNDDLNDVPAPEGVEDVDPAVPADDAGGQGMKPTPTAIMQACQHLEDGAQALEDLLTGGALEHEKGIAVLTDHIEELRSLCADLTAKAGKMFPDAGFGPAEAAPDAPPEAEPEVETTDDGAIKNKAFPAGFPVRFRTTKAGTYERITPAADEPAPAELKAVGEDTRDLLRELKRERRGLQRDLNLAAKNRAATSV